MQIPKRRVHVFVEARHADEAERLAALRHRSLSDTLAYLIGRGLEREAHTEMVQLTSAMDAFDVQIEQMQAMVESLESREAERFRLFLGHLQQHQAITTELLHLQRLMFMDERPGAYAKVIESAREQVTEDARVFRASLASGGAARRKMDSQGEAR